MKHFNRNKSVALLLALTLVLAVGVGGTLAFLHTKSNTVTNSFEPGEVSCEVQSDNTVRNTGTVKAYIRVAVVANWANANGSEVHSDYLDADVTGVDWELHEGYYYYKKAVDPVNLNGATSALQISLTGTNPDSTKYNARVQILAEAIQAEGGAAVAAWGVDPSKL